MEQCNHVATTSEGHCCALDIRNSRQWGQVIAVVVLTALATLVTPAALAHHFEPFSAAELKARADHYKLEAIRSPFPGSVLYVPKDGKSSHPGVILLHGSDGGDTGYIDFTPGMPLAAQGYAVLALDYYHSPGLPQNLRRVRVERAFEAARWMKTNGYVSGKPALLGYSRGAEFALIIGSKDRGRLFSAILTHANFSVVGSDYVPPADGLTGFGSGTGAPAWTFGGKPLRPGLPIELWRFPGPVYLSHSGLDWIWPSIHSVRLKEQANKRGKTNVTLKIWPKEDHVLATKTHLKFVKTIAKFFRAPTRP